MNKIRSFCFQSSHCLQMPERISDSLILQLLQQRVEMITSIFPFLLLSSFLPCTLSSLHLFLFSCPLILCSLTPFLLSHFPPSHFLLISIVHFLHTHVGDMGISSSLPPHCYSFSWVEARDASISKCTGPSPCNKEISSPKCQQC